MVRVVRMVRSLADRTFQLRSRRLSPPPPPPRAAGGAGRGGPRARAAPWSEPSSPPGSSYGCFGFDEAWHLCKNWISGRGKYVKIKQTLTDSFSAVSKQNFARKYALESSRWDLHNALLCTALRSQFFVKNLPPQNRKKSVKLKQLLKNFANWNWYKLLAKF